LYEAFTLLKDFSLSFPKLYVFSTLAVVTFAVISVSEPPSFESSSASGFTPTEEASA